MNPCNSCKNATSCIDCAPNYIYDPTTETCLFSCPNNYYTDYDD